MSKARHIPMVMTLVGLALAGGASAQPAPLVIEAREAVFPGLTPGIEFPREILVRGPGETVVLRAVGSGIRRQLMFKVYEGALYCEAGTDLGADPFPTLIRGDFVRHLTLKFLRDVTGDKVSGAIDEGFEKVLRNPDRDLRAARAQLLGYFEGGIKARQTIELTLWPGKGLYTRVGDEWQEPIRNDALIRAIMEIWLGPDPVAEDLKQDLVRFETGN